MNTKGEFDWAGATYFAPDLVQLLTEQERQALRNFPWDGFDYRRVVATGYKFSVIRGVTQRVVCGLEFAVELGKKSASTMNWDHGGKALHLNRTIMNEDMRFIHKLSQILPSVQVSGPLHIDELGARLGSQRRNWFLEIAICLYDGGESNASAT